MKDTLITAKQKKWAFGTLLACFLVAFGINLGAIINYGTPWYEIFTQIGFVVVITVGLYIICGIVAAIVCLIRKACGKCRG